MGIDRYGIVKGVCNNDFQKSIVVSTRCSSAGLEEPIQWLPLNDAARLKHVINARQNSSAIFLYHYSLDFNGGSAIFAMANDGNVIYSAFSTTNPTIRKELVRLAHFTSYIHIVGCSSSNEAF